MTSRRSLFWVVSNSGLILSRLWTKVHQIKYTLPICGTERNLHFCNAFFPTGDILMHPGNIPINARSCPKSSRNFNGFGTSNVLGSSPTFLTQLYKSGSPSSMWQSLMTLGQETSKITPRKEEFWPLQFLLRLLRTTILEPMHSSWWSF